MAASDAKGMLAIESEHKNIENLGQLFKSLDNYNKSFVLLWIIVTIVTSLLRKLEFLLCTNPTGFAQCCDSAGSCLQANEEIVI